MSKRTELNSFESSIQNSLVTIGTIPIVSGEACYLTLKGVGRDESNLFSVHFEDKVLFTVDGIVSVNNLIPISGSPELSGLQIFYAVSNGLLIISAIGISGYMIDLAINTEAFYVKINQVFPPENPEFTFKPSVGIIESGGKVISWTSVEGNYTVTDNSVVTNRPDLIQNVLNSKPCVRFSGTNRLSGVLYNLGNAYTICIVYKNNNYSNIKQIFTGNTSTNSFGYANDTIITHRANNKPQSNESGLRLVDANNIIFARKPVSTATFVDNGYKAPPQANAAGSFTATDLFDFCGISDFTAFLLQADIYEVKVYKRTFTDQEIDQWNLYVQSNYGISYQSSFAKNIMCVGDSITVTSPSLPGGYPTQLKPLLASDINLMVFARQGRTAAQVLSSIVPNTIIPKRDTNRLKDIVVVMAGTNDLIGGATGMTAYNNVKAIHDALRNAGFKTIACTIPPASSNVIPNQTVFNTERGILNNTIISNASTFCDALCDCSADPFIGIDGASNNTTHFLDKLHFNVTGGNLFSVSYLTPAIQTLLI